MRRSRHIYRKGFAAGQALAEFAITAIVGLIVIVALFDLGLAVSVYNAMSYAAREGARYAIAHPKGTTNAATSSSVRTIVTGLAPQLKDDTSLLTVTLTWPANATLAKGVDAEVDVSYKYTFTVPFIAPSVTMSSSSRMFVGVTP